MPSVMIRKEEAGHLSFYIAKKDLEEAVTSIEYDAPNQWGGKFELADGTSWYIEPLSQAPSLPITLRAKRA